MFGKGSMGANTVPWEFFELAKIVRASPDLPAALSSLIVD
jgi:hypothetical protein